MLNRARARLGSLQLLLGGGLPTLAGRAAEPLWPRLVEKSLEMMGSGEWDRRGEADGET